MRIKGRTDPNKTTLIRMLKSAGVKNNSRIWGSLADDLSKSNRNRTVVNLSHLNRVSSPEDVIVVPGKVLGGGSLNHPLEIAAESFSVEAQEKIRNVGGKISTFKELIDRNPKGSKIRIIK
jgi:large subunit ribosomal protein L18e